MTYAKSNSIVAGDFNSLAGTINALAPYASSVAATQKVAALWGVGYGDRGYGQKSLPLNKKTVGRTNECLWQCTPSGDGDGDGGWNTNAFPIDRSKKYRSTVWVKVKNLSGNVYHGPGPYGDSNVCNLDGSVNSNPYWIGNSPGSFSMEPGQWYLSVGILHESTYTGGYSGISGLYDIHGNKIYSAPEYKSSSTATYNVHRAYHYYDTDSTQRQWFARPRFEAITGSEPAIASLISASVDAYALDTLINPSSWAPGAVGTQGGIGVFGLNQTTNAENVIILANGDGPTGSMVKAQDFLDLRSVIASIASYQGTATTLLPPTTEFAVGGPIKAEVPATTVYDFPTMIANIDNNRLVAAPANMTVIVNSLNVTRSTTWGANSTGIVCEVQAAFNSENEARYFFNSGGTLNLAMAHSNTTTLQNSNWNAILNALGTIKIGARSTTRTGSGGTPAAIGYYNLTTVYQTIFDGTNIGAGAYAANDVLVEALTDGVTGFAGGNGTTIRIRITLSDQHLNSFSDIVAAGTVASFGLTKAAQLLTGIASPTYSTLVNF